LYRRFRCKCVFSFRMLRWYDCPFCSICICTSGVHFLVHLCVGHLLRHGHDFHHGSIELLNWIHLHFVWLGSFSWRYPRVTSIHCLALRVGIRCLRIRMAVSHELDRIVKICVFMTSSGIFAVVPIMFLRKAMSLVKYSVTVSSGDSREAVNFHRTSVRPSFVTTLSSQSLSSTHICTGSSRSSMSGSSTSQHLRCTSAIALFALSCQSSCRERRATPLPGGRVLQGCLDPNN